MIVVAESVQTIEKADVPARRRRQLLLMALLGHLFAVGFRRGAEQEGDFRAVRRPANGLDAPVFRSRHGLRFAAVRRNEIDLALGLLAVGEKGDPLPVRRPARAAVAKLPAGEEIG